MAGSATHVVDVTMFWNPSGGVRRYILAKRAWLEAHTRWRHTVASPTPDGAGQASTGGVPLPWSGGAYRFPVRRGDAARRLLALRPDLIEAADPYTLGWAALDVARALRVPAVAFCHSNLERIAALPFGGLLARGARRAARAYAARLYGCFDLVLAPSTAMVEHLRDWGVTRALRQPLGVDTRVFAPTCADPGWKRRLGLRDETRVLLYVGRFSPEKNLETLCGAVDALGPRYQLVAIGAGPVPPTGARVTVLAPLHDDARLATAMASADVFVHAGDAETFGLAPLEAMACGTPVVARRVEGLADLMPAHADAMPATGAPREFAEAIAAAFDADRAELSRTARRVAERYDWAATLPILWRRYAALLGRDPAGGP